MSAGRLAVLLGASRWSAALTVSVWSGITAAAAVSVTAIRLAILHGVFVRKP